MLCQTLCRYCVVVWFERVLCNTGRSLHKYHFCHDKHVFVVTKHVFCRNKKYAYRDKSFNATKLILVVAPASDSCGCPVDITIYSMDRTLKLEVKQKVAS